MIQVRIIALTHTPLQLESAIFRRVPKRTLWLRTEREFNVTVLNSPMYNHLSWGPEKVIYFFKHVSNSWGLDFHTP